MQIYLFLFILYIICTKNSKIVDCILYGIFKGYDTSYEIGFDRTNNCIADKAINRICEEWDS